MIVKLQSGECQIQYRCGWGAVPEPAWPCWIQLPLFTSPSLPAVLWLVMFVESRVCASGGLV